MDTAGRTAIIVALITTLGVLGAKYMDVFKDKPPPPAPARSRIAGIWNDQFSSNFSLTVTGSTLTLAGSNGSKIMQGTGTVEGTTFTVSIANNRDKTISTCSGAMQNDTVMIADCADSDGNTYGWQLRRAGI